MRTFALIAAAGMSADAFLMKRDDESAKSKCAGALSGKGFAAGKADSNKCTALGCKAKEGEAKTKHDDCMKTAEGKKDEEEKCDGMLTCGDDFGPSSAALKESGCATEDARKGASAEDERVYSDTDKMKEECLKLNKAAEKASSLSF